MLNVQFDEEKGIAILEPEGALTEQDFKTAAGKIDPHIEKSGNLRGIVIRVRSFPGWDTFSALMTHLRFVKNHHRKVSKVAFVTDSPIGHLAEKVGGHFVQAEVREFPYNALEEALVWILN
ncbi:MAG: STAS/SEC14 domain-containing protein [Deltaproteobacteria bacterium]|nr:STAS/SEC14 domain-containing protein [Deltaproteobacteria bacterium]MBW2049201.1 STAS/SEC14 domain-containing protein [Deltaproteobacteria bacterium]MBW2112543.1 STAS/SEC14 domain-containing protein [Deltaproteobacteria bacterium]MBW2353898.1 STAS/SEC14 domain-containing protein [Deltaproteobacteria bacterium]